MLLKRTFFPVARHEELRLHRFQHIQHALRFPLTSAWTGIIQISNESVHAIHRGNQAPRCVGRNTGPYNDFHAVSDGQRRVHQGGVVHIFARACAGERLHRA